MRVSRPPQTGRPARVQPTNTGQTIVTVMPRPFRTPRLSAIRRRRLVITSFTPGGRKAATESQKQAARQWAIENQPWRLSTGPRTPEGKAIACFNPHKTYFRRRIKASQVNNFPAECEATERFITLLRSQLEAIPDIQFNLTITRRAGGQGMQAWAYFGLKIHLVGEERNFNQVWRQLDLLVDLCGW